MKIGFVLDDSLDNPDGVQQYILTVGDWLTNKGHQVHYLVGSTKRSDIANVHSLGKNVGVKFNGNRLSIPISVSRKQIQELLAKENFDVIHVQMPYSPLLAGKVIKYVSPKTAVVGTFHILPYGRLQTFGTWALTKMVTSSLSRFDSVLAVSTAAKKFADNYLPVITQVVPNAVNLAKFAKGKKIQRYNDYVQNIVFLGRLVERKGCLELLEAINLVVNKYEYKNIRLIIVGRGPLKKKIDSYVTDNYLSQYVEMVGWINEQEKPDYLSSADVAVFPSLSGESFGIVLVEAVAAGAGVVLGGDNPGYRYVLNDEADVLVNPKETEKFAKKIINLLKQKELRISLQQKQKQRIKSFDVSRVGPQLEAIYTKEIAKRAHNRNNGYHE